MFNAERLLGSLVTTALTGRLPGKRSRRGLARGLKTATGGAIGQNKGAIGMGVLGLAIAAFEHFSTKSQTGSPPMQYNRASTPVAPLPQRPDEATPHPALDWTPPPLPTAAAHPDPIATSNPDALLLIRAMIAAANADHLIDDKERATILKRVTESGLGEAEQVFIQGELANPIELRTLAAQVRTPEMAEQIFAVSLMAIDVDSEAEQNYLQRLASALKLAPSVVEKWEAHLAG